MCSSLLGRTRKTYLQLNSVIEGIRPPDSNALDVNNNSLLITFSVLLWAENTRFLLKVIDYYIYPYTNCSFDPELDGVSDCCNYCCSPPYVPGAGSTIYSLYSLVISILFPLAFIYIKMIQPDTNTSKFNTYRPNPGD
jgi:hypothetical protein